MLYYNDVYLRYMVLRRRGSNRIIVQNLVSRVSSQVLVPGYEDISGVVRGYSGGVRGYSSGVRGYSFGVRGY